MKSKSKLIRNAAAALLALALALAVACEKDESAGRGRRLYRVLRSEALALYFDMYPLRGSRMGLDRCDSLLFTYSEEESEEIASRLRRLESGFGKMPMSGLTEEEYDDSRLITRWVKGELFAIEHLEDNRDNPLLYCWIVDEALWGITMRNELPREGELAAYLARLEKIPRLLGNASRLVAKPARPHVQLASKLIRKQLADLPALEIFISERYGASIALPEELSHSLAGFLGFLEGTLSTGTRGNLILGSENIARILRYDESIEISTAEAIEEADKAIRRFKTELTRLQRSEVVPDRSLSPAREAAGPFLERALETIRESAPDDSFSKGIEISGPAIVARPGGIRGRLEKSLNLTLNPMRSPAAFLASPGPFEPGPCTMRLDVSAGLPRTELLYESLREIALARPLHMLCEGSDTVRTLLRSEIYAEIVRFLELEGLVGLFPAEKTALREALLEDKIQALAMTIAVLRLHAGTLTTESAATYLVETAGLSVREASLEVTTATYAPVVAYPGIALLEIDRMTKRATVRHQTTRPEKTLREALLERYFMPMPDIFARLPAEI
jgi:hypothetical protein